MKSLAASVSKTAARATSDFFVGEARVDVTKDETVVRLAMAQHGSVLIELPANDGPRYIIPGDPEMATVDQKALERNKRAIVVRPGSQFLPSVHRHPARFPSATVTAQMRSGLVVTFLFYPVADLSQNVHRCVLHYKRDEVVARRRAAGLPVNLEGNGESGGLPAQNVVALSSISVEEGEESKLKEAPVSAPPASLAAPKEVTSVITSALDERLLRAKYSEDAVALTRNALNEAINRRGGFKNWPRPVHGIALSVISRVDSASGVSVGIVAIRNTTSKTLQLLAGGPDLFVETLDDKGQPVSLERLKKIHVEANDLSGAIPAGGIVYCGVAYFRPVLDAHQQIRIVVGQTDAADEPASITIRDR